MHFRTWCTYYRSHVAGFSIALWSQFIGTARKNKQRPCVQLNICSLLHAHKHELANSGVNILATTRSSCWHVGLQSLVRRDAPCTARRAECLPVLVAHSRWTQCCQFQFGTKDDINAQPLVLLLDVLNGAMHRMPITYHRSLQCKVVSNCRNHKVK